MCDEEMKVTLDLWGTSGLFGDEEEGITPAQVITD